MRKPSLETHLRWYLPRLNPANRIGSQVYSVDQLKVIQEVITLSVFGVFSVYYFGDRLHWNHAVAFGCLVAGAFFMFHKF